MHDEFARADTSSRPARPRTLVLSLTAALVLAGLVVLPAFALEGGDDTSSAPASTTEVTGATVAGETTTTAPITPTTTTPEDAAEVALAGMSEDERRAFRLFTMSSEERDALAELLSPPEPEPEPAPAAPPEPDPEPVTPSPRRRPRPPVACGTALPGARPAASGPTRPWVPTGTPAG
ncbi:MAG: hypothetical protein U5R31_06145 [Acidimicrobiia bacterium]|nr:hypothetical protein [Acidimicrobiia bacterium]